MMDDFSIFLRDLSLDDPARNVTAIKNAVSDRLQRSDAGISIKTTDYFNHTYAPDLIIRWPDDGSTRNVFLRTTTNPEYLREDIAFASSAKAMFVPLASLNGGEPAQALEQESKSASALVATPGTIATFADMRRDSPVVGVLSRAVLQGGRGVIDQDHARRASVAVDQGFTAAQRADVETTREAVVAAEDLLGPAHSDAVTRLLHAVWLGSGASSSAFPGESGVTAHLDANSLQILLSMPLSAGEDFWRRIGKDVTLDRLCDVVDVDARSDSLQMLVNLNLDRFRAKGCRVADRADQLGDVNYAVRWFVRNKMLGLQSRRYNAFFSPSGVPAAEPSESSAREVSLDELIDRARAAEVKVSEVVLEANNGRQIDYKAPVDSDIASDEILRDLGELLRDDSSVVSAMLPLGIANRQIRCDLKNRTATGRTVAKYYLQEFLGTALPILWSHTIGEAEALLQLMAERQPSPEDGASPA